MTALLTAEKNEQKRIYSTDLEVSKLISDQIFESNEIKLLVRNDNEKDNNKKENKYMKKIKHISSTRSIDSDTTITSTSSSTSNSKTTTNTTKTNTSISLKKISK